MLVYVMCYGASYLFADSGHYYMSGISLIFAAIYLYLKDYLKTQNFIHLRALFSLFWVGGQGVSCLKLSRLQTDWKLETWLCFLVAFLGFWLSFQLMESHQGYLHQLKKRWIDLRVYANRIFMAMVMITGVSLVSFLFEAAVLGFIPFFIQDVPHAYSTFHISGVHYFTVSCVLVPSLSVIYLSSASERERGKRMAAKLLDVVALAIPILCVSRFQLILAVGLAVLTLFVIENRTNIWYPVTAVVALIPVYIILTVARSHDVAYLNGIFEMKNGNTPIFVTQPYMYIANNYDNFNAMVEQLPAHTWGLKMLFPVWALTGLKFLIPSLVNLPIFVTKKELTTVTLFYDAYYDFGILGVLILGCILGVLAYYVMRMVKRLRNPIGYLFYAQIAMYLMLSFFTTWFSNPTTWFWLFITGVVAIYVDRR